MFKANHFKKIRLLLFFFVSFFMCYLINPMNADADETAIPKGNEYIYGVATSADNNNYLYYYRMDDYDAFDREYVRINTSSGKPAGMPTINSLAVRDDGLYVKSNNGSGRMARIDWNGVIWNTPGDWWVANSLAGTYRSGTFLPNGYYVTTADPAAGSKLTLLIYDIDNRALIEKIPMTNKTDIPTNQFHSMGDIAAASDGYLYAVCSDKNAQNTKVLKINSETGDIEDVLPITGMIHSPAIAFREDGRLFISDTNNKGAIVNFATGDVTYKDKLGQTFPPLTAGIGLTDFASFNFPDFKADLKVLKEGPKTASYGGTYKYTVSVSNEGSIMSTGNVLKDTLSKHLEYVPETTRLNDTHIPDKDKTSLIFSKSGLPIYSSDSTSAITTSSKAVVTFEVKVKDEGAEVDLSKDISIPNKASVIGLKEEYKIESNEVITKVPGENFSVYIKQEVLNPNSDLVVPATGYIGIANSTTKYTTSIPSYPADTQKSFRKMVLKIENKEELYQITDYIPEFYGYGGYQLSEKEVPHDSANRSTNKMKPINFSENGSYWLTVYIEPKGFVKHPPFYSWDYKTNDFGVIQAKK